MRGGSHRDGDEAMVNLTINLPDETHQRLTALAQQRGTSVEALIDETTSHLLAEADAEARFQARAAKDAGRVDEGLALIEVARGQGSADR
jgi:predicted transcriptional regulator